MSNYIKTYFWEVFENKDLKIIAILLFILLLFILMIIPIRQNNQFEEDAKIYKKNLDEINSKLDFQISTIQKTIDEQFNKWFDCNIINE